MRSRWVRLSVVLWILTWGASAWADDYGDIHVKGPRNVRIFLDDEFVGFTTKAQGGLILTRVRAGTHVLRAIRTVFEPQVARVTVKAGETLIHELRPFAIPGQEPPPAPPEPEPPKPEPIPDPGPEPPPSGTGVALAEGGGAFSHRILAESPEATTQKRFRTALDHALRWLAAHQSLDGGWEAAFFNQWCDGKPITDESKRADGQGKIIYDTGVTGLALCAFLGAGYTHRGKHPYAKVVGRGLRYLKSIQQEDGSFGPLATERHNYCHAACALAMVEAFGMTGSPWYADSAQRALDFIGKTRNAYFAWRYGIRPGDNDTSVSGWMIMVLKSAEIINAHVVERGMKAPLQVDDGAFDGMRAWLGKATDPKSGRSGYVTKGTITARPRERLERFPSDRSESLTAVAALTRMAMGERPSAKMVRLGVKLCGKLPPEWSPERGTIDMYYWYYGTMLMYQVGGKAWTRWADAVVKAIVETQHQDEDYGTVKGSWDPIGVWGVDGGRVYATAFMAMCLEAHTRYARYFAKR